MTRKRGNLRWWIATLCGVCGVLLGITLGLWQLDHQVFDVPIKAFYKNPANTKP